MSMIKPIQATPELKGEDARKILEQVNTPPTKEALKKNQFLTGILEAIRTQ